MDEIYVILIEERFSDGDVHTRVMKNGFSELEAAKKKLDVIWKEDWERYKSQGRDDDDLEIIFEKRSDGMSFIEDFLDNDYTEYKIEKVEVN